MTGPEAAAEGSGGGQELTTAAWVVAKLREGHGIVAGSDRARATADLIEELGGRVAALEAALRSVVAATKDGSLDDVAANARAWTVAEDALSGGTTALNAAVAKAVAAERARVRAVVQRLPKHAAMVVFNGDMPVVRLMPHPRAGTWLDSSAVETAIGGAS